MGVLARRTAEGCRLALRRGVPLPTPAAGGMAGAAGSVAVNEASAAVTLLGLWDPGSDRGGHVASVHLVRQEQPVEPETDQRVGAGRVLGTEAHDLCDPLWDQLPQDLLF